MRITLTLDDDIYAKLEAKVRGSGCPLERLVNEYLRRAVTIRCPAKPVKPFVVRARALGLRPGLDYDNIGEMLEQIEGPLDP